MDGVLDRVLELGHVTAWLVGATLGPLAAGCVALYGLERALDRRLEHLLGRHRMWVTAWIGTPVHELSHAAMCLVFRHRIEDLRLFKSDDRDDRLGYVRHSYDGHSLYQRIGGFFIALAPLFGGSAAIVAVFVLVHPEPVPIIREDLMSHVSGGTLGASLTLFVKASMRLLMGVFDLSLISEWRFWMFGYLAFAIGSHLAPSTRDLRNAAEGGLLVLLLVLTLNVALLSAGIGGGTILTAVTVWLSPILAVLVFAITLNAAWLLLTWPLAAISRRSAMG